MAAVVVAVTAAMMAGIVTEKIPVLAGVTHGTVAGTAPQMTGGIAAHVVPAVPSQSIGRFPPFALLTAHGILQLEFQPGIPIKGTPS